MQNDLSGSDTNYVAQIQDGFTDGVMEAFAGPHDYLGSWGYTPDGLINSFSSLGRYGSGIASMAHTLSAIALIPVAAPFALASAAQVYAPIAVSTAVSTAVLQRQFI